MRVVMRVILGLVWVSHKQMQLMHSKNPCLKFLFYARNQVSNMMEFSNGQKCIAMMSLHFGLTKLLIHISHKIFDSMSLSSTIPDPANIAKNSYF